MFFSGNPSTRKRVDLDGRSSKERDRQKLLEQTNLERNKRLWLRQQNSAAIKIQKCFRGRKVVEAERSKVREQFIISYGKRYQNLLISGSVDGFDLDDLRSHTNYAGGYHREHCVIDMFWEVLKNFTMENQRKFLKFLTGCSRGPLLGFKHLEPLFCIQRAAGDASEEALDRLPTSATCMNLVKLPPYRSKEQMEKKLLYSINADAGFDLS